MPLARLCGVESCCLYDYFDFNFLFSLLVYCSHLTESLHPSMPYQEAFLWRYILSIMTASVLSSGLLTFILRGIYNRYFHPLRSFPGPFWSSITDLSKLSALSCSDITAFSLRLHRDYGLYLRRQELLIFRQALMSVSRYHRPYRSKPFVVQQCADDTFSVSQKRG